MTVRMRHTHSHTKNRRSHHALRPKTLAKCQKCGVRRIPHAVCANCGFYRSKEMVDVLKKLSKKERKAKEKEINTKAV